MHLPYNLELSNKDWKQAMIDNTNLYNGLNIHQGNVTHQAVAKSLEYPYNPIEL